MDFGQESSYVSVIEIFSIDLFQRWFETIDEYLSVEIDIRIIFRLIRITYFEEMQSGWNLYSCIFIKFAHNIFFSKKKILRKFLQLTI